MTRPPVKAPAPPAGGTLTPAGAVARLCLGVRAAAGPGLAG